MNGSSLISLGDIKTKCSDWRSVWPLVAVDGEALVVVNNGDVEALIAVVEAAASLSRAEDANSEAVEDLALSVDDTGALEERQRATCAVCNLAWANLEAALARFDIEDAE